MMNDQRIVAVANTVLPPPFSSFTYRFDEETFVDQEFEVMRRTVFLDTTIVIQSIMSGLSAPRFELKPEEPHSLGPVPMTVEIQNKDGALVGLSGLPFTITIAETGETIFSNEKDEDSFRLTVTVHPETRRMSLRVNFSYAGLNVAQAVAGARFLEALSRGGEFRIVGTIYGMDTQLTALRGEIAASAYAGPKPSTVKLLERLALIQKKTGAQFKVPEGEISDEDLQNIRVIVNILETGVIPYNSTSWETTFTIENARGVLETYRDGKPKPVVFHYPEEQEIKVLGVTVPLGPTIIGISRAYITADDLEKLRRDIEASSPDSLISVVMSPYEDCPAEAHYLRWLPVEHAAAIFRMSIFSQESPQQFLFALMQAAKQGTDTIVTRFAELLSALRKNVTAGEASAANPLVTCSPEELLEALILFMHSMDQKLRFTLAAMLFKYDVLSSGKAARFAGMDRVSFLMDLHKVGVPVIDLDEEQLESQARYVNSR